MEMKARIARLQEILDELIELYVPYENKESCDYMAYSIRNLSEYLVDFKLTAKVSEDNE